MLRDNIERNGLKQLTIIRSSCHPALKESEDCWHRSVTLGETMTTQDEQPSIASAVARIIDTSILFDGLPTLVNRSEFFEWKCRFLVAERVLDRPLCNELKSVDEVEGIVVTSMHLVSSFER